MLLILGLGGISMKMYTDDVNTSLCVRCLQIKTLKINKKGTVDVQNDAKYFINVFPGQKAQIIDCQV